MAGTIVRSVSRYGGTPDGVEVLELLATADASDGSFPTLDLTEDVWGTLLGLETNPGSTAPTDNYDITLVDADGYDRLESVGLNRDTANTERAAITGAPWVARGETLTLTIANSSVNSATITIKIYYTRLAAGAGGASASVTSVIPGTGATNLGKAIDTAAGATDTGVAALFVHDAALTALTPIDGDWVPGRVNGYGAVWTDDHISGTGTLTTQADQATSATLLSFDAARKGFVIVNDSDQALYLKYGATATSTDYTYLLPAYATLREDRYNGRVDGIWAANSTGSARVTSLSA